MDESASFPKSYEQTPADCLRRIRQFHKEAVQPYRGEPRGCHPEEVAALEKRMGFELPLAYRQYLVWMGHDQTGIFKGSECFLNDVTRITQGLPELLRENGIGFRLPEHYLAFFSHQGYHLAWFALPKTAEDPAVWSFNEVIDSAPMESGCFTEFILQLMQKLAPLLPELYSKLD